MNSRRVALLTPAATLLLCLVVACGDGRHGNDNTAAAGSWRKPAPGANVLLISIDSLRADRLGFLGHADARTPRLDALADRGVVYEQTVTPTPVTLPAHASLMTGRNPTSHGVRHNGSFVLPYKEVTLAERLQDAGYRTSAVIGSFELDRRYGLAQGFDDYDDAVNRAGLPPTDTHFSQRAADSVSNTAIAWLNARASRDDKEPFFLWLHYFDPHQPYSPPPPFDGLSSDYDGEIAFVDQEIGRVIDSLKGHRWLDETLIVVTSDHGEALGAHGEQTHGVFLYDPTVRVPLVFVPPGGREPRRIRDRPAGLIDVMPTVLDLLGLPAEPSVEGIPLDGTEPVDRGLFLESLVPLFDFGWAPLRAWRTIDRKYILAPRPEWYRLDVDPAEQVNQFPAESTAASVLALDLTRYLKNFPDPLAVAMEEPALDKEAQERLASLGYVRGRIDLANLGAHDPKDRVEIWTRISHASVLAKAGRLDDALDEVQVALVQDPTNSKAWYTALRIHDARGEYAEAEKALQRALVLRPRADAYAHLATYCLRRGDIPAFDAALARAEAIDPFEGDVWLARGVRAAIEERYPDALRSFRKAVELDPWRAGPKAKPQIEKLERLIPSNAGTGR